MPFYLIPPNRVIHADLNGYTKIDKDTNVATEVPARKDVIFVELQADATGRKPLKEVAGQSVDANGKVLGYLVFDKN